MAAFGVAVVVAEWLKWGAKLTSQSHLALFIVSPSTENQPVSTRLEKREKVRGSRNAQKSAKNHDSERKVFFVKADKVERLYCIWKDFIVSQHYCPTTVGYSTVTDFARLRG